MVEVTLGFACFSGCSAFVHKGCRESLASCAKVKMKVRHFSGWGESWLGFLFIVIIWYQHRPKQPNENSSLKRPSLFLINTLGNLWLLENKMLSELRVKYTFLCVSSVSLLKWVCSEPRLQACPAVHTPHFLVATLRAAGGIRGL